MWKMYWKFLILISFCIFSIHGQDISNVQNGTSDSTISKPETTTEQDTTITSATTITETSTTSTFDTSTKPTPIPVTTSKPIPPVSPPSVNENAYNVSSDNKTCILLKAGIQFEIENKVLNLTYNMNPNETVVADGSTCDGLNGTQIMILEDKEHTLTITFAKNEKTAYVRNISLSVPEESGVTFDSSEEYFSVTINNSYLCKDKSEVKLSDDATVLFHDLQLQAFMKGVEKDFSNAEECGADNKMDDIVPIIVACALVLMIVIILIGYLITRRQSRQRGYQSV